MNEKKERLTTGENFQNMHGITNIQQVILSRLQIFARAFEKKYPGTSLNFNVSNWGEAAGGIPQPESAQDYEAFGVTKQEGDKEDKEGEA